MEQIAKWQKLKRKLYGSKNKGGISQQPKKGLNDFPHIKAGYLKKNRGGNYTFNYSDFRQAMKSGRESLSVSFSHSSAANIKDIVSERGKSPSITRSRRSKKKGKAQSVRPIGYCSLRKAICDTYRVRHKFLENMQNRMAEVGKTIRLSDTPNKKVQAFNQKRRNKLLKYSNSPSKGIFMLH